MDPPWRLGRIIHGDHLVVIDPVDLRPVLRGDVGGERPDVPRAEVEDVGHAERLHPPQRTLPRPASQFTRCNKSDQVAPATVGSAGRLPMRAYLVEINAKLIVRSDTDPQELPADIYSQLAEFIPSDDDIVDLDVSAFLLPGQDDGGQAPH